MVKIINLTKNHFFGYSFKNELKNIGESATLKNGRVK
tara:strand:+ start:2723 stop:2833 length:111 start_codon:yes stop_codon:yes gene_type:complete